MNNEAEVLKSLGLGEKNPGVYLGYWKEGGGKSVLSVNPATGKRLGTVGSATADEYEEVSKAAHKAFERWRVVPGPQRGALVREIGNRLREKKEALGALVAMEMGKIKAEGEGEVQEMIDMADYAVGLSRQLFGLTIQSERPGHRLMEQWHPLGTVGIITAFNFPVAVWAWNAFVAFVCGDSVIWKPSSKTPLSAVAVTRLAAEGLEPPGFGALAGVGGGGRKRGGGALGAGPRGPVGSATGLVGVGRPLAGGGRQRLGRTILELGGNNGISVMPSADLDMAVRAILFGAVGTAGQRCTSTRRLFLHAEIAKEVKGALVKAYGQVTIGNPLDEKTLMGPLVDAGAVRDYLDALERIKREGGTILCGGHVVEGPGFFVEPTLIEVDHHIPMMSEEVFAPILYLQVVDSLEEAIALNNGVPQGLSSSLFSRDYLEAERFLSATGSDCGLANLNAGTSGAEIGGAFGGEKETGGGREAGSDSWKAYMRRQTNTINYSDELPLSQGISFG
ncbi:aldehyde dehydrogenase family protein [bacterium]|nr:aldehyde dehydrogenase family protein [bacterium]